MRDELLGYYEKELNFLRKMGAEFSKKYPKVAARLQLGDDKTEDPHVERMIEAFAFLSSRVQLKLDDELPEITESFLNVLYPHYLAPIPSMAIAQFSFGSPNDKLTAVQRLEKGSKLHSRPVNGTPCRFQTSYDTNLFPIELLSATLESPAPADARGKMAEAAIRLSFRCFGDANLSELKIGETGETPKFLRFYLNGDTQTVFPLYELIFNHSTSVEFRHVDRPITNKTMATMTKLDLNPPKPLKISAENIKQVGFAEDEGILPYTKRSFIGYRLLTEYFTFPYKFLFFDIFGFDKAVKHKFGSHFEILIHLKDITPPRTKLTADNFKLGCSPIVNLFSQTSDPIYLSQQKYEYHVIPDVHRQATTEVYSVDQVFSTDPRSNTTRTFEPFYSLKHAYGEQMEKAFWYANRRQSTRQDDEGTEIFLSTVDANFNPRVPATEVLTIKTTCTNRDLPAKLPFGGREGDFEVEGTALFSKVKCLTKPTETVRSPKRRAAQWRLISHLNLNLLSLDSKEALQEILSLYNFEDNSVIRKQILGISEVKTRKIVRQIGERIGTGFVRGIETIIEFDEEEFVGSSFYLFASVLEKFLGLYVSLNSFNQLVIRTQQREEEIKRWKPRTGEQILL
jgi:type VI secretion system protein ImpG